MWLVAPMPRRELTIRAIFKPTRSSSLQLEVAYEMVMPQVERVVVEPQQQTNAEGEFRLRRKDRR